MSLLVLLLLHLLLLLPPQYAVATRKVPKGLNTNSTVRQLPCTPLKSGQQGPGLCLFTAGGFHVACDYVPWTSAADACAAFGFTPANLNNENQPDAQSVMDYCYSQETPLWIGSYNGYAQDPCMFISAFHTIFMADAVCSLETTYPVLCQEYARTNTTSTTTVSTTASRGTSTVVLPTYDPNHCQAPFVDAVSFSEESDRSSESTDSSSPGSSSDSFDRLGDAKDGSRDLSDLFMQKSMRVARQTFPCPAGVCPVEIGNLRLVFSTSPSICSAFGWNFADITTGEMVIASALFEACGEPYFYLQIRSYNGISGTCVFLTGYELPQTLQVGILNDLTQCTETVTGWVLCNAAAPTAFTGTGIATQSLTTTTTWTTTIVITSLIPTATTTLTSYASTPI